MFEYIAERVCSASTTSEPFAHVYVEDFFAPEHFAELIAQSPVSVAPARSDREVIDSLHAAGFKEIKFPGTTTDINQYLDWHCSRDKHAHTNFETTEGFGITMRLQGTDNPFVTELLEFLKSDLWLQALSKKFDIDLAATTYDNGMQKYLDGYEISPHPDICKKALTYMVNINPSERSESLNFHTHYMKLRPAWRYVGEYWKGNPDKDRCWVPWEWCETVSMQRRNNTIVIFKPDYDTMHAVKASYDHLPTQRTQLYGNLWYRNVNLTDRPNWRDYVVEATPHKRANEAY